MNKKLEKEISKAIGGFSVEEKKLSLVTAVEYALNSDKFSKTFMTLVHILMDSLQVKWDDALSLRSKMLSKFDKNLIELVRGKGRMSFDDYFHEAMYGEKGAYVDTIPEDLIGGCFHTLCEYDEFAVLMLHQFKKMWDGMDCPKRFDIVEMGAGKGTFAYNLHRALNQFCEKNEGWKKFRSALKYSIVEISQTLAKRQDDLLTSGGFDIDVINASVTADKLPIVENGIFFSVELVDMFAPKKIVNINGRVHEIYVIEKSNVIEEVAGDLSSEAKEYIERYSICIDEGETIYIKPMIDRWTDLISKSLIRGYNMIIDYGFDLDDRADPMNFRCYYRSKDVGMKWFFDLLRRNKCRSVDEMEVVLFKSTFLGGHRDMTCDVDITAMEDCATMIGMTVYNSPYENFAKSIAEEFKIDVSKFDPVVLTYEGGFVQVWCRGVEPWFATAF